MRHVAAQQGFNTKKSRDVAQRKEILKEFGVLFPHPPPDFQALYHNIALDARTSPSTAWQEVVATYEKLILDNESYGKKGNFLKKSAWYCIISLLDQYDKVWHARKYHAEMVADLLTRSKGQTQKQRVEEVAASVLNIMIDQKTQGTKQKTRRDTWQKCDS